MQISLSELLKFICKCYHDGLGNLGMMLWSPPHRVLYVWHLVGAALWKWGIGEQGKVGHAINFLNSAANVTRSLHPSSMTLFCLSRANSKEKGLALQKTSTEIALLILGPLPCASHQPKYVTQGPLHALAITFLMGISSWVL